MTKRYLLDTNVVIRLLTNDPPAQALAAQSFFQGACDGHYELVVSDILLFEVVFVLQKVYHVSRSNITKHLQQLLSTPGINFLNRRIMEDTIRCFSEYQVDFSDAYHAAVALDRKISIASFDRDFDKFKNISRFEPRAS